MSQSLQVDIHWEKSVVKREVGAVEHVQYLTLQDNVPMELGIYLCQHERIGHGVFVSLEVQGWMADGSWATLAKSASLSNGTYGFDTTSGFSAGILDVLDSSPERMMATIKHLEGGVYRVVATTQAVFNGRGSLDMRCTIRPAVISPNHNHSDNRAVQLLIEQGMTVI